MSKEKKYNTKYSPEFKLSVIIDMLDNELGYEETARKYCITGHHTIKDWEHIYLTEGAEGLMAERRRSKSKRRPKKEPSNIEIENDLVAENQRLKKRLAFLEMENEYLKKLDALIRAEEKKNGKKPK